MPCISWIWEGEAETRDSLVVFIKQYRDRALQCKEALPKPNLVYGCIKNMEDASQIFLSLGTISMFFESLKRAADVSDTMRRSREKAQRYKCCYDFCATKRGKKCNYKAIPPPKSYGAKTKIPPILLPQA